MRAKSVEQEKTKNPAYEAATGEWVLDRAHADPVFAPRPRAVDGGREEPSSLGTEVRAAVGRDTEARREALAASVAAMGCDTEIVRESEQISELFAAADADGLACGPDLRGSTC